MALTDLCEIRTGPNASLRPFCQLLTEMPLWLPDTITDCAGREFCATSLLGPLFSITVFAEEDPLVADKYFSGKLTSGEVRAQSQQLQQELDIHRVITDSCLHPQLLRFYLLFKKPELS